MYRFSFYRITDEVVVACKLLNGHLYKGKEIGREQMVSYLALFNPLFIVNYIEPLSGS